MDCRFLSRQTGEIVRMVNKTLAAFTMFAITIAVVSCSPAVAKGKKKYPKPEVPDSLKKYVPVQSGYEVVVPSDGLPEKVQPQNANNNLDVVRHGEKVFLAFRTAPNHFASPKTELYVVSSTDQENWDYEAHFQMDTDLREPRLLSFDGKLFLYFAVLGSNPLDFEPKGTMVSEYGGPGDWTEPEEVFEKGFIPWRARTVGGVPYVIGYRGGENIYDFMEESQEQLLWLTTKDGIEWNPVVEGQPVVYKGGCSETDFAFTVDGAVVAVCRNELGDKDGYGSKVCRAEADAPGDWKCRPDPKKYDSPLVFKHGGNIYLVGRRNISRTGNFDLGKEGMDRKSKSMSYQLDYWKRPKRCSIWLVDPDELKVHFLDDLPSKGDTCFASVIAMSENEYMLYNYTSPPDGPDISWNQGQQGHTLIYRMLLKFEE